ncbi:protocadherin-9 [Aplysia californica]|uniref:Protocadherin-9 n=1 Tax=Aplysia californica TaxID=6500 RepID=A0ABM1AFU0_APLCA|nr:protocadherin-9 [Aplysia californica]
MWQSTRDNSGTSANRLFAYFIFLSGIFHGSRVQGQLFDLEYTIDEEQPVPSTIGRIGKDSNISQLLSSDDYGSLRYRLLIYPDADNNLFTIGNTTGLLKTSARIDRETLCHYEITCKLTLRVAAQTESGQQFYTFKVTIYVRDTNDNPPVFPLSSMTVKINEDAAVSTSIPISSASDIDIMNNTIQRYMLKTPSDTFGLKVTRNLDGSLVPQLYVKADMDREQRPYYYLKIVALDGGVPRRSGELAVNVTLSDVNDNAPRFSQQTYDVFVDEVAPLNSRVWTLTATDADVGQNGRVRFRLGTRQSEESFNTFRVIPESGNIVTVRELTSLQGETLRLVVEAIDHGAKPQTAQAEVNIHVVDSVNNPPVITMTLPAGSRVSRVSEKAEPGFVVAHFMVEDADQEENGRVSCHLQDDTFGLQKLKESEYKVTVYDKLDRERTPFYDVTITCMDSGSPSMSTHVAFSVILEDANDNPPRFLLGTYKVNVTENSENTFIVRVEAEDIDLGKNGRVNYRLGNVTSLVSSYISVNSLTGEISAKQMLDRELFKTLHFRVVAEDEGNPSMSSEVPVVITVLDENDNFPRVPVGYSLSVRENMPVGTLVGRIEAIDPDEGASGQVGYRLLTENEATRLFNLSQNGEVRTLATFDREFRDIYDINVLARDYGPDPSTNILHIRIIIADDNDHAPVFRYPRDGNRSAAIALSAKPNTTIVRAVAVDDDLGQNSSLTYTITAGADDVFEIEPRTGRIYTLRRLYTKDKGTYTVKLFVRDNGPFPLSARETVILKVTQGNGTAAAIGYSNNDHIIIVAILVGATVFIAIIVFLIVLRFLRKDRRERRPKYTSGLPMEVKKRSNSPDDEVSSDEGPWRRYDEAKRPNGPTVTSGDVSYDANDDIIMFKLKLADQYKELEPEDKDRANRSLPRTDRGGASNRTSSVISDEDGAPDVSRDRTATRLATFQSKLPPLQASGYSNGEQKEKVWRSALKDKMADEILSSSSRETSGADSGRGPSEDGSQSRSSVTDDSGCLVSPSHSILRVHTPKHQGNTSTFTSPTSATGGYERPPFLMTFQTNSPEHTPSGGPGTDGNGTSGGFYTGPRKEYPYPPPPSAGTLPSSRFNNTNPKEVSLGGGGREKMRQDEKVATVHRIRCSPSPELGRRNQQETSMKQVYSEEDPYSRGKGRPATSSKNSTPSRDVGGKKLGGDMSSPGKMGVVKSGGRGRGGNSSYPNGVVVAEREKFVHPPQFAREVRLCSEPPISRNENGEVSTALYNPIGVQETGPQSAPPSIFAPRSNTTKPMFVGSGVGAKHHRLANQMNNPRNVNPNPNHVGGGLIGSSSLHPNSNPTPAYKQSMSSCPQLFKDPTSPSFSYPTDPYAEQRAAAVAAAASRSKSFTDHAPLSLSVTSRSVHDFLNDSLDTQDDGNTTTTSGSYTIDHEDFSMELPQTDVFV